MILSERPSLLATTALWSLGSDNAMNALLDRMLVGLCSAKLMGDIRRGSEDSDVGETSVASESESFPRGGDASRRDPEADCVRSQICGFLASSSSSAAKVAAVSTDGCLSASSRRHGDSALSLSVFSPSLLSLSRLAFRRRRYTTQRVSPSVYTVNMTRIGITTGAAQRRGDRCDCFSGQQPVLHERK